MYLFFSLQLQKKITLWNLEYSNFSPPHQRKTCFWRTPTFRLVTLINHFQIQKLMKKESIYQTNTKF